VTETRRGHRRADGRAPPRWLFFRQSDVDESGLADVSDATAGICFAGAEFAAAGRAARRDISIRRHCQEQRSPIAGVGFDVSTIGAACAFDERCGRQSREAEERAGIRFQIAGVCSAARTREPG